MITFICWLVCALTIAAACIVAFRLASREDERLSEKFIEFTANTRGFADAMQRLTVSLRRFADAWGGSSEKESTS